MEISISVSPDWVKRLLWGLDTHKAKWPHGLHPLILRELAGIIAVPLADLFPGTLDSENLLRTWTETVVCPIYKGGTKTDLSSYMPITLTSITCKLLERITKTEHYQRARE